MSSLIFYDAVTLLVERDTSFYRVAELLEQDLNQPSLTPLEFCDVTFNEELAKAFVDFFQNAKQTERRFDQIEFHDASRNAYVDLVLREAYELDLFKEIALWRIGWFLSFNAMSLTVNAKKKNLKMLDLSNIKLSMEWWTL